ncbi:MAG: ATP-binding cassette domain-containing protein [Mariprofundales bacterium]|nr:ATP-binding cassette domain-containing protein [Mariprofundales bacterium]
MIISNVRKQLGAFSLDISWCAGQEIIVLFGASGCGKSTILRLLAGLEQPDAGRIVVAGRTLFDDTINLRPEQRNIGYVPQYPALFPWLNVRENMLFAITKQAQKGQQPWIDAMTEQCGATGLLGKTVSQLSGGEAQRVALVRALVTKPSLLLLDEPFSAVDGSMRIQLRKLVQRLQQEWAIPVVMVTHDQTEAHLMGHRLIRLDDGRVKQEGKIDAMVQQTDRELRIAY